MKAGDIVVCKRDLVLVQIEAVHGRGFNGCRVVSLTGPLSRGERYLDQLRPLTPEEQAAYSLGWRGPVLPSLPSFPSVQTPSPLPPP